MTSIEDLVTELGDRVRCAPEDLEGARTDKSGWIAEGVPLAVVEALSIEDVQAAMRFASRHRIPVVPRGAGTGLAGGGAGTDGSIVLSTVRMNRILSIEPADELAVVEPGVINEHLNTALQPYGLVFSPDPASRAISTVGGNIATNAGGLLCAKYGVTRDAVLGLTVVLADGSILRTGHRTVKGVTGYDLTALFVGSEGTLGVIVEAIVRLRPAATGTPRTLAAFFPSIERAASASAAITAARLRPAVMELMDHHALEVIDSYQGTSFAAQGGAFLMIQTDGPAADAEAGQIERVLADGGGAVQSSVTPEDGERLLAIRRGFHPAMESTGHVLIEDVAVPRSRLADMFTRIRDIEHRYGLRIPTVAHAGDGNLHPNFMLPGQEGEGVVVPELVWRAADEMFTAAVELGGTLTGEHGVGMLKRRWLSAELGDRSVTLQRQIKAAFDPDGIMNPGKVFDETAPER